MAHGLLLLLLLLLPITACRRLRLLLCARHVGACTGVPALEAVSHHLIRHRLEG